MLHRAIFTCLFLGVFISSAAQAQTADYYVATDGNDSWSGTLAAPNSNNTNGPFASISRAQTAVQQVLANPNGRTAPITVMVRQGTYWQSQALQFGTADSGTSQLHVTWKNYPNETAVISGGLQLTDWSQVSGNEWQISLPASTQYFEQLFYNGQRRLRPRLGSSTTNVGTYYRVLATVFLNGAPPPSPPPDPNCSVYVNGSGWECFDRFQYSPSDPISGTWKNLAPPAGNPCGQAAGNANLVGDIQVIDFEVWTVSRLRISCIDTANQIIYMTGPTSTAYEPAVHGFLPNHRYLVENIQDQLQEPGQWFLDRSGTPWVLTYLANPGEDPKTDLVVIPQATQVLVASQLQYVTFQGLSFEHDDFVVPAAGYQSNQGDYGIPAAVSCQNCNEVVFDSDVVTQTSGGGLELVSCVNTFSPSWCVSQPSNGTTSQDTVENGAFYDIGAEGLRVGSGSSTDDTNTNVPHGITVQDNVIEGVGRAFPSTYGIAQGSGHDNTYTHNTIYDSYHSAIGICESGCSPGTSDSNGTYDITISFNHVYNLMQGILSDTGALYLSTGAPTFTASGNQVLNNKVHDVTDSSVLDAGGYGGYGIKLDYDTGSVLVENNLVYRTTDHSMSQTDGPQVPDAANTIKNNILSFTGTQLEGVVSSAPVGVSQFEFSNNLVFFSQSGIQIGCAYCAGGNCLTSVQKYVDNMYCDLANAGCALTSTPFRTTTASCQVLRQLSWSGWQALGEDVGSMQANPLFVAPFYPTDNFALQSGSTATDVGFVPFDVNAPGCASQCMQPPAIAATFPTGSYIAPTTLNITSNFSPATYGQTVTLTATASSNYGPPPDGTQVTFIEGGQVLGTASTVQGAASLPVSSMAVGQNLITASFPANAFWPATTSNTFSQYVNRASSTTAVESNLNPSTYGKPITFTAAVSSTAGTPTGTVTFSKGAPLGTVTLSNGVAKFTISTLPLGQWEITAKYAGDTNFLASSSPSLSQTVSADTSVTVLTATPNPSTSGQTVTFTATVSSTSSTPTGQVTFQAGSTVLGNHSLSNGVAVFQTKTLSPGTYSVTATYNGNDEVAGSTSNVVKQKVNQ
ncbi:MAG: Ig-like domain repeat protein [Candidatus Sulfotelmatobacter sp.]